MKKLRIKLCLASLIIIISTFFILLNRNESTLRRSPSDPVRGEWVDNTGYVSVMRGMGWLYGGMKHPNYRNLWISNNGMIFISKNFYGEEIVECPKNFNITLEYFDSNDDYNLVDITIFEIKYPAYSYISIEDCLSQKVRPEIIIWKILK